MDAPEVYPLDDWNPMRGFGYRFGFTVRDDAGQVIATGFRATKGQAVEGWRKAKDRPRKTLNVKPKEG